MVGYNWAKKGIPIRRKSNITIVCGSILTRASLALRVTNQLSTHALLANAYYDYQLSDTPAFSGGGVGWAQNVSDVAVHRLSVRRRNGPDG